MKQLRTFPQAVITQKGARFLAAGNVWVYDAEVLELRPAPSDGREAANGDLVDVLDQKGTYLGTGLLSQQSKIRIRLVSRNANDRFDEAFWERKVQWAWNYRQTTMGSAGLPGCAPDTDCCRVIFSEADQFPGLVVDRYDDVLVTESLTVGMERLRPTLFPLIVRTLRDAGQDVRAIYERNDAKIREKEGLPLYKGWYQLPGEELPGADDCRRVIAENGVRYEIDLENSQKTGFFLDQKYNRRAVARLARGRRVLDCFTHVGSFALNCAVAGAEFVHGVDVSATAVDLCRRNAELNGVAQTSRFTCTNVFDFLPALEEDRAALKDAGGPFDLIVLDPPAFTKNRKTVREAARGYRQINYRAMKLLPRGGYLATCSCSHFMETGLLADVIREAAHDAGVQLRQVEARQQAPDHPIVWGVPETDYLKFFIFQVV
jgi:23S rRNA (cytosine1962-C5)-methyltransferase